MNEILCGLCNRTLSTDSFSFINLMLLARDQRGYAQSLRRTLSLNHVSSKDVQHS